MLLHTEPVPDDVYNSCIKISYFIQSTVQNIHFMSLNLKNALKIQGFIMIRYHLFSKSVKCVVIM